MACSHGGHLTQMLRLLEAFEGYEFFFITYKGVTAEKLAFREYLLENIGKNLWRLILSFLSVFRIILREKPDLVLSTGSEIAIPVIYISWALRIPTIYVESWSRIRYASRTGRIVYPVVDVFLVQWKSLLRKYGSKAIYAGAVI